MANMEFKNNARSTVADNPLAAGATILNVAPGEGGNFPSSFPFLITIWDSSPYPGDDSEMEIVKCTGRTTDALTIVRAQEGTADVIHSNGEKVAMLITAGHLSAILSDLATHEADTSTHGVTTVTGISEIQTLTNKTIDGDNNTIQDIALTSLKNVDEQSFTNLLQNGDFESWSSGANSAPDGWIILDATIARDTNSKVGSYASKLTNTDSVHGYLYIILPNYADLRGKKISAGVWINTSNADRANIYLQDDTGIIATSSNHSGGGNYEFITLSADVDISTNSVWIVCRIIEGTAINVYFDGAILVEGSVCPAFSPKPLVDDGIMLQSNTPSAANDYGKAGQWCYDANYIYVCTATDTWKRIAIATW